MVTLGTGVGGGVVLNGKVLMGESGVAGEIGHMTVNPFETEHCNCGKTGCLEQYASATGMVRVAKQLLAERREDSLLRQKEVTAKAMPLRMRLRMWFRSISGLRLPMRCILWIRRKSYLAAAFLRQGSCFCGKWKKPTEAGFSRTAEKRNFFWRSWAMTQGCAARRRCYCRKSEYNM